MYSYTYGDSESLVDARQTCKNLAIRDALESYYLFVESTTEVENFQLKDDLIHSITAGNVRDIKVLDQSVDGRTITMTVTGTVDPEEIKSLVEKQIKTQAKAEANEPAETQTTEQKQQSESLMFAAFNEYETKFRKMESNLSKDDPQKTVTLLQSVDQYLIKNRPKSGDAFTKTIYACVVLRNKLLGDIAKLKLYQKQRNRLQAVNQRKVIRTQADKLEKAVNRLKAFDQLGAKKNRLCRNYGLLAVCALSRS